MLRFFPPPQHNFEFSPPQRELREENRGENRGEEKVPLFIYIRGPCSLCELLKAVKSCAKKKKKKKNS